MKVVKWVLICVGGLTVALLVGVFSLSAYVGSAPVQDLTRSDLEAGFISENERTSLAQACSRSSAKTQLNNANIDCACLVRNADLLPRFTREALKAGFDGDIRRLSGLYKGLAKVIASEADAMEMTRQEAVFAKQCGSGWSSKLQFTRTYGTRG